MPPGPVTGKHDKRPLKNQPAISTSFQYILDAIALLAVGASLWVGNALVGDFDRTMDETQEWTNYAVAASNLSDDLLLAQAQIDAALGGADIAASRARTVQALEHYRTNDIWLTKELLNEEVLTDQPRMIALLREARDGAERAGSLAPRFFEAMERGNWPKARSLQAQTTASLEEARTKAARARDLTREVRQTWRTQQANIRAHSRVLQVATAIALFGLLTFLTVYGHYTRAKLQASGRALAEAERARESMVSALANNLDGAIFRVRRGKNPAIEYISPGIKKMMGVDAEDLVGVVPETLKFRHPDDVPAYMAEIAAAVAEKRPYDSEHRLLLPDGSIRWIQERGTISEYTENGLPALIDGLMVDVTEQHRLKEELQDR